MQRLTSREFEDLCKFAMEDEERKGKATMSRYGVQASMDTPAVNGQPPVWQPIRSLPDFEGIIAPEGQQFTFDCKVTSNPSVELRESHFAERQLKHLIKRDRFGAIAFLLVHFNPRQLKKTMLPAETFAMPVSADHPFWEAVDRAEIKSLSRATCEEYAVRVEWVTPMNARKPRPDLLTALIQVRGYRLARDRDTIPG